jgi:hypothetical protein
MRDNRRNHVKKLITYQVNSKHTERGSAKRFHWHKPHLETMPTIENLSQKRYKGCVIFYFAWSTKMMLCWNFQTIFGGLATYLRLIFLKVFKSKNYMFCVCTMGPKNTFLRLANNELEIALLTSHTQWSSLGIK